MKPLLERLKIETLSLTDKFNGNGPEKLLYWRCRDVKFVRLEKLDGKGYDNPLDLKLKIWRFDSWLRVFRGIGPWKLSACKGRAIIDEQWWSHVTLVQLLQAEEFIHQFIAKEIKFFWMQSGKIFLSSIGSVVNYRENSPNRKSKKPIEWDLGEEGNIDDYKLSETIF